MAPLPDVGPTFEWIEASWGPALCCRSLGAVAPHLFTSRQLRLSGDGPEMSEAWNALATSLAVSPGRVTWLHQVHGTGVVIVRSDQGLHRSAMTEGDALISDDPGVVIAVKAADCAPILLADRRTGSVGAVHAGWRGTAAGIVGKTVTAMQETFGTRPADLVAAIGPAIGTCCYEVGTDLVDAFAAAGHARHLIERWFLSPPPRRGERGVSTLRLDLAGANRDQLVLAGLAEGDVHLSGLCTANHLDVLTSFRAEREHAGRLAGAIRARGVRHSAP
ncbi:MAG: peptidoglycan editing factor PgeF [Vicinamibacterales bacterium]